MAMKPDEILAEMVKVYGLNGGRVQAWIEGLQAHLSAQAKVRVTLEDAQAVHAAIMTSSGSYEDGSIHLGVDDVMHGLESFAARLSQGAQGEAAIGDLLAIIHRDGGHYQSDHGTEKAARDAIDVVHAMKQQLAERAAVPDDAEEVSVSLGDDAQVVREYMGDDSEVAENMERAAQIIDQLTAAPHPPEGARVVPDEMLRSAYRRGFLSACDWPEPCYQDTDSEAYRVEREKALKALLAAPTLAGKDG